MAHCPGTKQRRWAAGRDRVGGWERVCVGEAGGRRSPLGSRHSGLESGEVQVTLSLRNGCVSPASLFPSASASSDFGSVGPFLGKAPPLTSVPAPLLELLYQTNSNSSLRSHGTGGSLQLAGKGALVLGWTGDRLGWVAGEVGEEGLNSGGSRKVCRAVARPRPGHKAPEEQPHPGAPAGYPSQEISLPNTSSTRGVSFMLHSGWKDRQRYCLECSSLRLRRSASFWIILA